MLNLQRVEVVKTISAGVRNFWHRAMRYEPPLVFYWWVLWGFSETLTKARFACCASLAGMAAESALCELEMQSHLCYAYRLEAKFLLRKLLFRLLPKGQNGLT